MKKQPFRQLARERRNAVRGRKEKSAAVERLIMQAIAGQGQSVCVSELSEAKRFYIYISCRSEVETEGILAKLGQLGRQAAAPRVSGDRMAFYLITGEEDLETGCYGVREPKKECVLSVPEKGDVILVPGLAFDRQGNRMGYGKGFYDRYLSEKGADCIKIGLAFEEQIYECVPVGEQDVRMDAIVTPDGWVLCKKEGKQ